MKDLTGYKLTFSDEFDTRSISKDGAGTKWADIRPEWKFDANSDIGFGRSSFVDASSGYDPFKVDNGVLTITAVPDRTPFGYPGSWESGLIHTRGEFAQTYGYFEMRADLSEVKGAWDAFWMLPVTQIREEKDGWQEIDIVEHYGSYTPGVYSWIHTTDYHANPNETLQVFSNHYDQDKGFHTYGMDWNADTISFYVDGELMGTRATPSDMHGPMFILANLATQEDADPNGPSPTMKIDYIRAYARADAGPSDPVDTGATVNGTAGNDTLRATSAHDKLVGLGGGDTYYVNDAGVAVVEAAKGGWDRVVASSDYTLAKGQEIEALTAASGTAALKLTGNELANRITGNDGNNVLSGGAGSDRLEGGAGNDRLYGGQGWDHLTGGAGRDVFVFDTAPSAKGNVDAIHDFSVADDTIWLDRSVFAKLGAEGALAADAFWAAAGGKAHDASDRMVYDTRSGDLYYDADGSGAQAAIRIAHLDGAPKLTADDFLVIA